MSQNTKEDPSLEAPNKFLISNLELATKLEKNLKENVNKNIGSPPSPININVLMEAMKNGREMARQEEKRIKETPPYYPPLKDRVKRTIFAMAKLQQTKRRNPTDIAFKQTFVTAQKHSSKITDLSSLKQIFFKDLMVNKIHYGAYLICRVIAEPYQIMASIFLVEDESGAVEDLSIYNYHSDNDPKELFPIGTVFLIKEPFLRMTIDDVGTYIRIDSPSDIIVDDYQHAGKFAQDLNQLKFGKDAEGLKKQGNEYYKAKKFDLSLRCYKIALNFKSKQEFLLHLNCSAAYLEMELYSQAYLEARKTIDLLENYEENSQSYKEKAYFRMAKCCYLMRQWSECEENVKKCLKENPDNLEAKKILENVIKRIKETSSGVYDFHGLYKKYFYEKQYNLDAADYFNENMLKLLENKEKGRFLAAKTFIPKGTLLMVSKAISYGFFDINEIDLKSIVLSSNLVNNTIDFPSQCENLKNLLKRVHGNPHLAKEIYSLYSGNLFKRDEVLSDHIVDVSRLERISSFNSFDGEDILMSSNRQNTEAKTLFNDKSTGIWIKPSYINHSCIANTSRSIFGDIMMIFAQKNIEQNEEISNVYVSPLASFEKRQEVFTKFGFVCSCELCEFEKKNNKRKQCDDLTEKLHENINDKKKIEEIIFSLEKIYSKEDKFKIGLFLPFKFMGDLYFINKDFARCVKVFKIIFNLVLEVTSEYAVLIAYLIEICYFRLGNMQKVGKYCKIMLDYDFFKSDEFLLERVENAGFNF